MNEERLLKEMKTDLLAARELFHLAKRKNDHELLLESATHLVRHLQDKESLKKIGFLSRPVIAASREKEVLTIARILFDKGFEGKWYVDIMIFDGDTQLDKPLAVGFNRSRSLFSSNPVSHVSSNILEYQAERFLEIENIHIPLRWNVERDSYRIFKACCRIPEIYKTHAHFKYAPRESGYPYFFVHLKELKPNLSSIQGVFLTTQYRLGATKTQDYYNLNPEKLKINERYTARLMEAIYLEEDLEQLCTDLGFEKQMSEEEWIKKTVETVREYTSILGEEFKVLDDLYREVTI